MKCEITWKITGYYQINFNDTFIYLYYTTYLCKYICVFLFPSYKLILLNFHSWLFHLQKLTYMIACITQGIFFYLLFLLFLCFIINTSLLYIIRKCMYNFMMLFFINLLSNVIKLLLPIYK